MTEYLDELAEEAKAKDEFMKNFAGLKSPAELKAALIAADAAGESWPAPSWLRLNTPSAMAGVEDGWAGREPAPKGALVLRSAEEQRLYCGDRWFLFPLNRD